MKQTLEKAFYLILFIVTFHLTFVKAQVQDTIGKYVNTKPLEQHTLKDGRILVILDDLWKNTQLVPFENKERFLLRKGSVGLPILFELPDTINSWVVDVYFTKYTSTAPPPPDPDPIITSKEVNDNDLTVVRYSSGWNYQPVDRTKTPPIVWPDPFLNDDVHFTYQKDAWVEHTFTGDSVDVFSEYQANHGKARIEIRNPAGTVIKSETADMYKGTTINSRDVIYRTRVPKGTYTIRVIFSEPNTLVTPKRDSMVFDSFKIYSIN